MVLNEYCCCVDLRVGVVVIGILEILKGLACLVFTIDWDTVLTAIAYVVAGICIIIGGIRRNTTPLLITLVFLGIGASFLALSILGHL